MSLVLRLARESVLASLASPRWRRFFDLDGDHALATIIMSLLTRCETIEIDAVLQFATDGKLKYGPFFHTSEFQRAAAIFSHVPLVLDYRRDYVVGTVSKSYVDASSGDLRATLIVDHTATVRSLADATPFDVGWGQRAASYSDTEFLLAQKTICPLMISILPGCSPRGADTRIKFT